MKSAPPLKPYELINLIAGGGVTNQLHVTVDQVFTYLTVNKVIDEPHVVSFIDKKFNSLNRCAMS